MIDRSDITKTTSIVFFTGAGLSAESGIPTYRGSGGIWHRYNWREYASQMAFDKDPEKVIKFHNLRRELIQKAVPNRGHVVIQSIEKRFVNVTIITQNIDGLHQRSGATRVIELHGSIWQGNCTKCSLTYHLTDSYYNQAKCDFCGNWLRPSITWFGDNLDPDILQKAMDAVEKSDIFISVGTSGSVYPAAEFPFIAKQHNSYCIEINLSRTLVTNMFDKVMLGVASAKLSELENSLFGIKSN